MTSLPHDKNGGTLGQRSGGRGVSETSESSRVDLVSSSENRSGDGEGVYRRLEGGTTVPVGRVPRLVHPWVKTFTSIKDFCLKNF